MVPFVKGDPEADFWKQNPEIKIMPPFSELFKKKDSSKIMWAIYLWKDPKSPWNRVGVLDPKLEVEEHYLKGKIDLDKYSNYGDAYRELCLTVSEKIYLNWKRQAESMQKHFDGLEWNKETESRKMDMLKSMSKIWDELKKAEADAEAEMAYRVRGGRIESVLETGDI